ncbi:MAG: hypothetical protein NC222_07035 [Staphylococcus sp.]|nr:hypothetical protein [Staphylococcus sp.]
MIKQLFSLIWTLFTNRHISYNLTNLWWYLTKGYTYSDVQDTDTYILERLRHMILDLEQAKIDIGIETLEQQLNKKPNMLLHYIVLYLSKEFDYFKLDYQKEIEEGLKKELSEHLFDLWL